MDHSKISREPLHPDASRTLTGAVLVSSHSWTRDISPGQKTNRVLPVLPLSGPNEILYFIWKIIVPESGREPKLLERQSKVSTVIVVWLPCHLLVLVHCDLSGQKSAQHLTGDFRTLNASSNQLLGDGDLIFSHYLEPAHPDKSTNFWFKYHCIPLLRWPKPQRGSTVWVLSRNNETEDLHRSTIATWAVPRPLHVTPHCCSGWLLYKFIHLVQHFSVIFFLNSPFLFLWAAEFWVFITSCKP